MIGGGALRSVVSATDMRRTAVVAGIATLMPVVVRAEVLVPGSDTVATVWPLFSAFGVLVGSTVWTVRGRWLERTAGRSGGVAAVVGGAAVASSIAAAFVGGVLLVVGGAPVDDVAVRCIETGRNLAMVTGAAVVAACIVGEDAAWCPVLCWVVGSWLAGSQPRGVPPRPWAWLLQPAADGGAAVAAAVLVAAGVGVTVVATRRPGRTARGGVSRPRR